MTTKNPCPCCSQKSYSQCCGRYIENGEIPETAEALMRSRYTAYSKANIAYIQATMREQAALGFDPIGAEQWAKAVRWKRLKVLRTFPHETDPNCYYVEFTAYMITQGKPQQLNEISEFKRIEGRWYYTH